MNRRSGQNGTIVIQSGWYRVRWRMDVEGQQERINMTAKIAPVVIDKRENRSLRLLKFDARLGRLSSNLARTQRHVLVRLSLGTSLFASRLRHI
jgi:hypothetical protein